MLLHNRHSNQFKPSKQGNWILKLCDAREKVSLLFVIIFVAHGALQRFFEVLQHCEELKPFVPRYDGIVESDGAEYIKIENLMSQFEDPCVMDVKMGIR